MTSRAKSVPQPSASVLGTDEAWENGALGQELEHVKVADPALSDALDESLGLQLISIRLQRRLVKILKQIAEYHNVAYQPMIRDLLNRFAMSEIRFIMESKMAELERQKEQDGAAAQPIEDFLSRERRAAAG